MRNSRQSQFGIHNSKFHCAIFIPSYENCTLKAQLLPAASFNSRIIFNRFSQRSLMKRIDWNSFTEKIVADENSLKLKHTQNRSVAPVSWFHHPWKNSIQSTTNLITLLCASKIHQFQNDWQLLNWSKKWKNRFNSMEHKKYFLKRKKACATCPRVRTWFLLGQRLFAFQRNFSQ